MYCNTANRINFVAFLLCTQVLAEADRRRYLLRIVLFALVYSDLQLIASFVLLLVQLFVALPTMTFSIASKPTLTTLSSLIFLTRLTFRISSVIALTTSHARTVVRECCKGDDESQWERVKFDPPPPKNPLTDGHQNLRT